MVGADELGLERFTLGQVKDPWFSLDLVHDHSPQFVDILEGRQFGSQSLANILRTEDRFEVHPLLLTLVYLYNNVLHQSELVLPIPRIHAQFQHAVRGSKHGLRLYHLIVKFLVDFVVGLKHEGVTLVRHCGELEVLQLFLHDL